MTQIIKEPTPITCSTSSLLDHILTNSSEKISQKGVIDVGISDHQLIYCTRKIKRIKHNMHNQIQVRSLKKYSAEIFTNALKTVQFPNYNIFSNVNVAYADLLNKISDTIDVAPIKEIRIKNSTQKWFDNEIAGAIKTRDKYFKKFKKANLQIDYNFYIEAKYNSQKLIKQKKIEFFNIKLTESIGKLEELWKSIKSPLTNICLKTKNNVTNFNDIKNANIFKKYFAH